ncbi:MAG: hypothetical protein JRN21_08290 [Nitrososphaerota archaeon]|nr:hypothetical protein [Nitrososphaerota archaeon]
MAYIPMAAGLVAALCWGTSDYLSRSQSEKLGSYKTVAHSHVVTLVVLLALMLRGVAESAGSALAPVLGQDIKPSLVDFSGTVLAMGILEAARFLSFTYGIITGTGFLPMVAALSGMGGAVAAGYGLVLLRERLELDQLAGILAIAGVFALLYFGG